VKRRERVCSRVSMWGAYEKNCMRVYITKRVRKIETEIETEKERERESVCVCVWEREYVRV
jgi:hypothetical protein